MGETLGKQYSALFHELTALHLYWKEFLELFATNDKRIERLNKSASGFFQMLQEQQFETNMLHLARLTDAPETGGKTNLTVCNLPNLVTDEKLKEQLSRHVAEIREKTTFCRDWRNRRFAHHDLKIALQDGEAKPLPAATKEHFNEALQALSDLMNEIERHYFKGGCSFADILPHNGAATLLFILGFGVRERERVQERIANKDFQLDLPESV
ncbi:MAG TPA: hypothetical protein V6C72_09135 [Chroococcales cyanobacterium]